MPKLQLRKYFSHQETLQHFVASLGVIGALVAMIIANSRGRSLIVSSAYRLFPSVPIHLCVKAYRLTAEPSDPPTFRRCPSANSGSNCHPSTEEDKVIPQTLLFINPGRNLSPVPLPASCFG